MPRTILMQATTRAGGDLNPMVALALGLQASDYDLTVLCDPPSVPLFSRFEIKTILSGPEFEVGPVVKAALKASQASAEEERFAAVAEAVDCWGADLAPAALQLLNTVRPDLILTSFFGTCIGSQLNSLSDVPWVALNSTFYIGPNPPRPLSRDFSARAADVFRYSVITYLPQASLVLHATDSRFDYDHRGLPLNHRYTGPLFWEAPGIVPAYVDEPGDPWILCTLSSLVQDDIPIARTTLSALAHRGRRVIVTLGPGHAIEEVGAIPANAHVAQYIPHTSVLGGSQLLVSHAGHGSVMKSLLYGVPMVLVPWSRDQFGVAARAEALGAAVVVPRESLSVHTMAEAIDLVLHEPRYRWAAEAEARRLRSELPLETALALISDCC
ncbi:MAG: nucleotide disphospho-sugar-binding domain-containing protein [Chloroflexota bacterium]